MRAEEGVVGGGSDRDTRKEDAVADEKHMNGVQNALRPNYDTSP